MEEVVRARGHEHVSAEHASTLELTSDDYLTPTGDCIIAIEADRVPADFDDEFVASCQRHDATITLTIEAGGHAETVAGSGHPELSFEGDRSFVCRTSAHVDDRTVMVETDRAATDLDRGLVGALSGGAEATATFTVG